MDALTKVQENKLTMYEGVETVFTENESIVMTLPSLVAKRIEFKGIIQSIKLKGGEKRDAIKGRAQTKYEAEDALVDAIIEIASPLYSYSRKIKNNEVMEICDITESKLRKLRDTELESRADAIQKKADELKAELADYNITAAMITDLQTKIAAYHTALGYRESGVATQAQATKTVTELIRQADEILNEDIDRLMERFRNTEPVFYGKYRSARVIKDLGIRHEKDETQPSQPPTP